MSARRMRFDIRQSAPLLLLVLLGWFVLLVGFYFGWVRPRSLDYRELARGSGPQLRALEERRHGVERLEGFLADLHQAQIDLVRLRTELLATRRLRMVEVQQELEALCRQFQIDLESVSFSSSLLEDEELDRLDMVLPLEGSYANLRKFLQAVESSEKFLLVERVALAEGKEGGVILQLNITLATYFDAAGELSGSLRSRASTERRRAKGA